jgi:hypothetical protein
MRSSVRLALAGTAVLAGVAFASPALAADGAYPVAPGNGPTVSSTETTTGKTVTFTAGGFQPGSTVTVSVSDGRSFSLTADSAGNISLSLSFSKAGTYTVTASGVDADGAARTVTASIVVNAAGTTTVSSNEGAPTTTASTPSSDDTGGLPFTGLELGAIAALGAATVIGGATVRVVARRRNVQA